MLVDKLTELLITSIYSVYTSRRSEIWRWWIKVWWSSNVIADNKNDFFDFEPEQEHLQILDSELIIGRWWIKVWSFNSASAKKIKLSEIPAYAMSWLPVNWEP